MKCARPAYIISKMLSSRLEEYLICYMFLSKREICFVAKFESNGFLLPMLSLKVQEELFLSHTHKKKKNLLAHKANSMEELKSKCPCCFSFQATFFLISHKREINHQGWLVSPLCARERTVVFTLGTSTMYNLFWQLETYIFEYPRSLAMLKR